MSSERSDLSKILDILSSTEKQFLDIKTQLENLKKCFRDDQKLRELQLKVINERMDIEEAVNKVLEEQH